MTIGAPDYGQYAQNARLISLFDSLELSRQLTSLYNPDGRGRTLYYNDFEIASGNVTGSASGAGVSARTDGDAFRSRYGWRLQTIAAIGATAQLEFNLSVPPNGAVGIGAMIAAHTNTTKLELIVDSVDHQFKTQHKLGLDFSTLKFYDMISDTSLVERFYFPDYSKAAPSAFFPVKYVFRHINGLWVIDHLFMGDSGIYVLGNSGVVSFPSADNEVMKVTWKITSTAAAFSRVIFDNLYLTIDDISYYDLTFPNTPNAYTQIPNWREVTTV